MLKKSRFKRYIYGALMVGMVCVVVESATRTGWLESIEHIYYDLWHQLAGRRAESQNVAIVAVDDQTLLEHKDEPLAFWGPHFARAIEVLHRAGVRAIGIDFLFSVSAESWLRRIEAAESEMSRTYDIPMRTQLNSGKVVLIATLAKNDRGENEILLPVVDFLYALPGGPADVGFSNLLLDDDEVVRRYIPALFKENLLPRYTFAALLARRAAETAGVSSALKTVDNPHAIGYLGPPGTIPRISFRQLLDSEANVSPEVKLLKNKVVIISAEHAGSYDTHLTPYAQSFLTQGKAMMTGAEVHANIVETLLTGRFTRAVPAWLRILWLAVIVTLGTFLFFRMSPVKGLICVFILGLICAGVAYLFFLNDWHLSAGNVHASLGLSFVGSLGFRFTREEKTRTRLQRVLGPYVSDAVVEKILTSGQLPDLGGESQEVTVLFSDIRGFTTISELLQPHEVVEMLNRYYTLVCEPIMAQEGFVDKFVGDAVMAVFGAPVSHPDQARRCILAALDMVKIAKDFRVWLRRRFPDRGLPEFRIGIGINSGKAVVGNIGSPKRMGYTAIGDTTNTASRFESMSKELGWIIVAGQTTVTAAGSDVATGRREVVQPRGRKGKIEIVEVLGLKE